MILSYKDTHVGLVIRIRIIQVTIPQDEVNSVNTDSVVSSDVQGPLVYVQTRVYCVL